MTFSFNEHCNELSETILFYLKRIYIRCKRDTRLIWFSSLKHCEVEALIYAINLNKITILLAVYNVT